MLSRLFASGRSGTNLPRPGLTTRRALLASGAGIFVAMSALVGFAGEGSGRLLVLKTPDGGIQPQAVVDDSGTIHLVYFKGEPGAGDLFYVHTQPGKEGFSDPVRVNSQPGSAIAVGTIRGAQIALGRGGRLHVAWNGSGKARPKNPIEGSPMLYSRSDEGRTAFEPQRNLMRATYQLDGGGTVAADPEGNVYVGWHGRTPGALEGETGRKMWVAHSRDDGATFAPEEPAMASETGACACCGTRALADRQGTLYLLYRAATAGVDRDMILLTSRDHGVHFEGATLGPWKLNACPMSSATLTESRAGVLAAWETKGRVSYARLDPGSRKPSPPISPPGDSGGRKHPAIAGNARGETIMVWSEGTGWQKGGSLAWQLFDSSDRPDGNPGRIEGGVPTWSLPTVVARPAGGFTIIH